LISPDNAAISANASRIARRAQSMTQLRPAPSSQSWSLPPIASSPLWVGSRRAPTPGTAAPGTAIGTALTKQWGYISGDQPTIITETGYTTSTGGTPPSAQGRYYPRLFLESFNRGFIRTFGHQLNDPEYNPDHGQKNFGIIGKDSGGSLYYKPAATAIKNLISLLSDTAATSL
jgi:hypothetical protein